MYNTTLSYRTSESTSYLTSTKNRNIEVPYVSRIQDVTYWINTIYNF